MCSEDMESEINIKKFFDENYKSIRDKVLYFFKDKEQEKSIKESFELYEMGKYYGAITIIIPLIDSFFYKEKRFNMFLGADKQKRSNYFDSLNCDITKEIMSLSSITTYDMFKSIYPGNFPTIDEWIIAKEIINRHMIIHGFNCTYGEKSENFLKCLSLINFLIEIENDTPQLSNQMS